MQVLLVGLILVVVLFLLLFNMLQSFAVRDLIRRYLE